MRLTKVSKSRTLRVLADIKALINKHLYYRNHYTNIPLREAIWFFHAKWSVDGSFFCTEHTTCKLLVSTA